MTDWQRITVAADRTHHRINGQPLYMERYDEALAFHAPGLAPVRRGDRAWHIDVAGRPAYAQRFRRTFGFYQALAAAVVAEGWLHIRADGTALYPERHQWCGNYQEARCAVRDAEGRYLHINREGRPAYPDRWRYVGDFRDGRAVAQGGEGRSTHIDVSGRLVHERWFLDLDLFHKGFARARDDAGWMHIDQAGRPLYRRRFAMVEPFYNGRARVERIDGALEIIDEQGQTERQLRPPHCDDFAALSEAMVGFWKTETIAAATTLGLFEALPASAAELAARCNLDPKRTMRLLRALGGLSLVARDGAQWRATPRGALLRADHPLTLADAAREYAGPMRRLWRALPDALRADSGWQPPDVFRDVGDDRARIAPHHQMLRSYARRDYAGLAEKLALRGDETVLEMGGGLGVVAEALLNAWPALRVILLDRPEVVAQVEIPPALRERLQCVAADFFTAPPPRAEVVLLARVLHDWDDERALAILVNARRALPVGGRCFIIERMLSEGGFDGGLCDLHLLAATGGSDRTATDYAALLRAAGFAPEASPIRLATGPSVLAGVAK